MCRTQVFLESELVRLQAERKVNKQTKLGLEMETMTLPIELEKCNVREDFLIFDFRVTINVDPEKRRILYQQIVHKEVGIGEFLSVAFDLLFSIVPVSTIGSKLQRTALLKTCCCHSMTC